MIARYLILRRQGFAGTGLLGLLAIMLACAGCTKFGETKVRGLNLNQQPSLALAAGEVYYVKEGGSDGHSCSQIQSEGSPARSIQYALNCVAQSGSGAGKEVRVFAGSYESFGFPARASGSDGAYLLIRANPGDRPVVYSQVDLGSYTQFEGFEVNGREREGNASGCGVWALENSTNVRIYNNIIHNCGGGTGGRHVKNFEIRGNWFHHIFNFPPPGGCCDGHGVYNDGSTEAVIDGNLFEDIGHAQAGYALHLYGNGVAPGYTAQEVGRHTVSNNVFRRIANSAVGCMGFHWDSGNYCNIYNNIVMDSTRAVNIGSVPNASIYNNTFFNNEMGISADRIGDLRIQNNIIYRSGNYENGGGIASETVSNNLFTNPGFVDEGGRDLRLQSGSVARGAGLNLLSAGLFTTDIINAFIGANGVMRPQGSAWDLGAFQSDGAPVSTATPTPTPTPVPTVTPTPVPTSNVKISVSATQVAPGATVTVSVSGNTGVSTRVALYDASKVDGAGSVNGSWQYLNGTQSSPGSVITSAILTFVMPTLAGTYDFRVFPTDSSYANRLAISGNVTVSGGPTAPDATAPIVTITSPVSGSVILR